MRPTPSTLLRLPALPRITLTIRLPRLLAPASSALASSSEFWRSPQLSLAGFGAFEEADDAAAQESEVMQWDGMLNAVPKKKVSHSRKAMRAANKGLKDRVAHGKIEVGVRELVECSGAIDLVHCAGCGSPKVAHHICATCYGEIHRTQKVARHAAELQAKEAAQEQQKVLEVTKKEQLTRWQAQRHAEATAAKAT